MDQPTVPVSAKLTSLLEHLRLHPESSAICCQYILSVRAVTLLLKRPEFKNIVGQHVIFEITGHVPIADAMSF